MTLTDEQLEVVNDSDALCEGCGADPRAADELAGWYIDAVQTPEATVAVIRCSACW